MLRIVLQEGTRAATQPCPTCTCDNGRQVVAESGSAAWALEDLQPAARQASLRGFVRGQARLLAGGATRWQGGAEGLR
eukprot:9160779-Alexandrium_andersonii.AAC.1